MSRPILPLAVLVAGIVCMGCPREAQAPREMARGYLAVMGIAAQSAGDTCADAAGIMKRNGNPDWRPLAEECADAYDVATKTLFAIEGGLNAWQEADAGKWLCAAGTAAENIERISRALGKNGIPMNGDVRMRVEDGLRIGAYLAKTFGGPCAVPAGGK